MDLEKCRKPLVFIFFFSLLFSSAFGLFSSNTDVLLLSSSEFKEKLQDLDSIMLVEFFAPWCGHCQNLAPVWEKAATALKGIVTIAAVDCDQYQDIAQEYGIRGFPTIKVFGVEDSPLDYQGDREAKSIVNYALSQLKEIVRRRLSGGSSSGGSKADGKKGSGPSIVLTSDNFDEKVLESKELWMVEFFAPWCGHCKSLAPEWKKAAKNLQGKVNLGQVDCTVEQDLAQRYGIEGFPTILVFGLDKENPTKYEGARTSGAIESFALEAYEENTAPPEILELIDQNVLDDNCVKSTVCILTFLPNILDSKAEGRNKYLETLSTVSNKFKKYRYSYVWSEALAHPELEQALGVGGYGYPAVIALSAKKHIYIPFKSSFQTAHLNDFIRSLATGGRGSISVGDLPKIKSQQPWDGGDGELPIEEEFSLEDLMAEDSDKSEL